jgi:uncharacterized Tic20 family protein
MDQNMDSPNATPENEPEQTEPQTPPQSESVTPEQPPASDSPTPEPPAKETSKDARMWAMLCHLGGLAMFLSIPFPFASVIIPLILWLIKKDDFEFVNEQGKEALNFQITIAIGIVISILLIPIVIGLILLPVIAIFNLVMIIVSSIEANKGNHYRYPFCIRPVK